MIDGKLHLRRFLEPALYIHPTTIAPPTAGGFHNADLRIHAWNCGVCTLAPGAIALGTGNRLG